MATATITQSCNVSYNGQFLRLAEGETVSGGLARFLASTGGPVDPDEDLTDWLDQQAAEEDEDATGPDRPADSDKKAVWVDYAQLRGIDTTGLTRAQIIEAVDNPPDDEDDEPSDDEA